MIRFILAISLLALGAGAQTATTWNTLGGYLQFVGDPDKNGDFNFVRSDPRDETTIHYYEYTLPLGALTTVWTVTAPGGGGTQTHGRVGYVLKHSNFNRDKIYNGQIQPIFSHQCIACLGHTGSNGNTEIRFLSAIDGSLVYPGIRLAPAGNQSLSMGVSNNFEPNGDTFLTIGAWSGASSTYRVWIIRFDAAGSNPPFVTVNGQAIVCYQAPEYLLPVEYGPIAAVANGDNSTGGGDAYDDILVGSGCFRYDVINNVLLTTWVINDTNGGFSDRTRSNLQMMKQEKYPRHPSVSQLQGIGFSGYNKSTLNNGADYARGGVYVHGVGMASTVMKPLTTPGTPATQTRNLNDCFLARVVGSSTVPVYVNRSRLCPNDSHVSPQSGFVQLCGSGSQDRRGEAYRHIVRDYGMTTIDRGVFTPDVAWYGNKNLAPGPIPFPDKQQHGTWLEPIRWTGTDDVNGVIAEMLCVEQISPNPYEYGQGFAYSGYDVVQYADEGANGQTFSPSIHQSPTWGQPPKASPGYQLHGETTIFAFDVTNDGYEEIVVQGHNYVTIVEQNTKAPVNLFSVFGGLWGYLNYGAPITQYERYVLNREFKYAR